MLTGKSVALERVSGRDNEYIIKDSSGITAGRVFIVELSEESRNCMLRIKFYRNENYDMLKGALSLLLKSVFNKKIYKAAFIVDESIDTKTFVDLGFTLEGVMEESLYSNGSYRSELIFGINSRSFDNIQRTTALSLSGRKIDLEVLTPENTDELLDYYLRNRSYLKPFEPAREDSFYTLEVQKKILIESYKQFLNGTSVNCGIYKGDSLIGKIQLSNIVHGVFKSAFVGYSIDERHQGKGYMKEALSLMLDYAFEDLELHRIEASTLVDNIRSQKVLINCGFKELGINNDYLFINGGWRDHVTFYRINDN
jgi:[ribosomal protein S5]-alanine N-acetyltransferase